MYKWNIDITLMGSGSIVHCWYEGSEMDSARVITKLFHGKKDEDWVGLAGDESRHQVFVVVGQIAAIEVYERRK